MLFPFALVSFIAANPGFAAWTLGGLITTIAVLIGIYYRLIYVRISALEQADILLTGRVTSVDGRVSSVESELRRYEVHVGAGETALGLLTARIERHMTEEEDQVWAGIRSVTQKLSEIQVENVEAHAQIKGQVDERLSRSLERLAKIETRMEAIQSRMPNGELAEIKRMVTDLLGR